MINWQQDANGAIELIGDLSQHSVERLMPIEGRIKALQSPISIELSKLASVDTAGLALLLELKAQADNLQKEISFVGSTPALDKLVALYNAKSLLED